MANDFFIGVATFDYEWAKTNGYWRDPDNAGLSWLDKRKRELLYWSISRRSRVRVEDLPPGPLRTEVFCMAGGREFFTAQHTELIYPIGDRLYSFSATSQDGSCCCRVREINYSHPYWRFIWLKVDSNWFTDSRITATDMADISYFPGSWEQDWHPESKCWYGPEAIPYDIWGVGLSFILKARLWQPDPNKVWCTEACCNALFPSAIGTEENLQADEQHPAGFMVSLLNHPNRVRNVADLPRFLWHLT